MEFRNIAITGGAGFVGANLATMLRRSFANARVTALDNLKRRGSELNLSRLQKYGVDFVHGDVRCAEDLDALPAFDLLIDCAAEPSVHAGNDGSPRYVLNTNLTGTIHCLEAARRRDAAVLFLSTSRVYPIAPLNALPYREDATRFRWQSDHAAAGFSEHGIGEDFPLGGPRSFYGASKLASELLLQEYVHQSGLRGLVNRCGVIAGPWQMGKSDQGVISLWVARHYFDQPLQYMGFGGQGKQVRDALHIDDLFDLIVSQCRHAHLWDGRAYNVGGGADGSVSLQELTDICRDTTGKRMPIGSSPETSDVDVRVYVTDTRRVCRDFDWRPQRPPRRIVSDIHRWIDDRRETLRPILCS